MSKLGTPLTLDKPTNTQLGQIQELLQKYRNANDGLKMTYDAALWQHAIDAPGTAAKADILKRVFTVLRWGGLYFRSDQHSNDWRRWHDTSWPIATALSHGGRVMIQLPQLSPNESERTNTGYDFLEWLTCGHFGKPICFERQGTHSIDLPKNWSRMLDDRIKVMNESSGLKHGATQATGISTGKSFGINLALGGAGRKTFATKLLIADDGCHGHLYIYFRPQTLQQYGGVLIGCEGEAPGCYGASGNYHSWNIGIVDKAKKHKPSQHEGQFGPKWSALQLRPASLSDLMLSNKMPLPNPISGPAHYDSLIVDLTATDWTFLKALAQKFTPAMVSQPAEPAQPIADVPKYLDTAYLDLVRRQANQQIGVDERNLCNVYGDLPKKALQLRLAALTNYKNKGKGKGKGMPLMYFLEQKLFWDEFMALVKAIYGP